MNHPSRPGSEKLRELLDQIEARVQAEPREDLSELLGQLHSYLQESRKAETSQLRPEIEAALRDLSLDFARTPGRPNLKALLEGRLQKVSEGMESDNLQSAIDHTIGSWLSRCYLDTLSNPFLDKPVELRESEEIGLPRRFSRQLRVEYHSSLIPDSDTISSGLEPVKEALLAGWGTNLSSLWLNLTDVTPGHVQFWYRESMLKRLTIPADQKLAWGSRQQVAAVGEPGPDGLIGFGHGTWIGPQHEQAALAAGCRVHSPQAVVREILASLLARQPFLALDIHATVLVRDALIKLYPALVLDIKELGINYQDLHQIFLALLRQHASLSNPLEIFSLITQRWPGRKFKATAPFYQKLANDIRARLPISRNAAFFRYHSQVTIVRVPTAWNRAFRCFPWARAKLIAKLVRSLRELWLNSGDPQRQVLLAVDDRLRQQVGPALWQQVGFGSQLALPVIGWGDQKILAACGQHIELEI